EILHRLHTVPVGQSVQGEIAVIVPVIRINRMDLDAVQLLNGFFSGGFRHPVLPLEHFPVGADHFLTIPEGYQCSPHPPGGWSKAPCRRHFSRPSPARHDKNPAPASPHGSPGCRPPAALWSSLWWPVPHPGTHRWCCSRPESHCPAATRSSHTGGNRPWERSPSPL